MMTAQSITKTMSVWCCFSSFLFSQDAMSKKPTEQKGPPQIIVAANGKAIHETDEKENQPRKSTVVFPSDLDDSKVEIKASFPNRSPKIPLPMIAIPVSMTPVDIDLVVQGKWKDIPGSRKDRRGYAELLIDVQECLPVRRLTNRMKKLEMPIRGGSYDKVFQLIEEMQMRTRPSVVESYVVRMNFELPRKLKEKFTIRLFADLPLTKNRRKEGRVYSVRIRKGMDSKEFTVTQGYGYTGFIPAYQKNAEFMLQLASMGQSVGLYSRTTRLWLDQQIRNWRDRQKK